MSGKFQKKYFSASEFEYEPRGGSMRSMKKGTLTALDSECCDFTDGTLKMGVGLTEYERSNGVVLLGAAKPEADFFFRVPKSGVGDDPDTLYYASIFGGLYRYDDEWKSWETVYEFGSRIKLVTAIDRAGVERFLFACDAGVYILDETGNVSATAIAKAAPAACFFQDRVFCAVEPYTLVYSAPLDPTNFTESIDDGGRVVLPSDKGKIVALLTMKNKLFVFYEYGISVLEGAGTAREFEIKSVEYNGGKVCGDSVGVCSVGGQKAFFLATTGLYVFDGEKARKTCENLLIEQKREGQVCVHAEFDGQYYLSYIHRSGEKRGICVNAEREKGYKTFYVCGACVVKGVPLGNFYGRVYTFDCVHGKLLGTYRYTFSVPDFKFGAEGVKTLQRFTVFGHGEVTVRIGCGARTVEKKLLIPSGQASMRLGLRGESFDLQINIGRYTTITGVEAEFLTLDGEAKRRLYGEN